MKANYNTVHYTILVTNMHFTRCIDEYLPQFRKQINQLIGLADR